MEELLRAWDGEMVVARHDAETGAFVIIAVHSTRMGPATGGTRMKRYASFEAAVADAMALSRAMTYKVAAAGFDYGGGKAVIALPDGFDQAERPGLLRRYGALLKRLGGIYLTAADSGTTPADMDVIAETGTPYVFSRTPAKGGGGDSGPPTALGVFSAMEAACEHLFGSASLQGRRVAVQGLGSVGLPLTGMLVEAGADVSVSDVNSRAVQQATEIAGVRAVRPEEIFGVECDIFSPCALGGALNDETIPRLRCRAVVGAANNPLASAGDAETLAARGILYVPDYIANAGGISYILWNEGAGLPSGEACERVRVIRDTTTRVLDTAKREGITTLAAANRMAEARWKR